MKYVTLAKNRNFVEKSFNLDSIRQTASFSLKAKTNETPKGLVLLCS